MGKFPKESRKIRYLVSKYRDKARGFADGNEHHFFDFAKDECNITNFTDEKKVGECIREFIVASKQSEDWEHINYDLLNEKEDWFVTDYLEATFDVKVIEELKGLVEKHNIEKLQQDFIKLQKEIKDLKTKT